jgi:hypothetical protein
MYEKDSKKTCNQKIIHFKFTNKIQIADFNNYKNDLLNELNKKERFFAINDIRKIDSIEVYYIKYLLDINEIFTNENKRYVGCTILLTNKSSEDIYNILMKFSRTDVPYFVTTSLEKAIKFILTLS